MAAVVLIESAIVLINSMHTRQQSVRLAETQIPLLSGAHDLKFYVLQVQQWLTDISATRGRDGLDDGYASAKNNARLFRSQIERLIALDPTHADRYREMLPVFNAYYDVGIKMAQAYIDEGPAGGNRMMPAFDKVAEQTSIAGCELASMVGELEAVVNRFRVR